MTVPAFKKINIDTYKPGKSTLNKNKEAIKLSANESALGLSPKVKKVLKKKNLRISKYPDSKCIDLRKMISKSFSCKFDKIICGSGSDEIIQMVCQLFLRSGDEVIVPQYSFLMYRIYSKIVGAKVIFSKEKNFKVSIENIIKKVNKKTKVVFLANPNNPTGTYLVKKDLINLRKKLNRKILLVIDDAYQEYMIDKEYLSGLDMFKSYENVFILRTFSKIYGLASLRIGWGYGHKKIIDALYKIKPPFNVNRLAQICAIESLKDKKFVKKSIKHNLIWNKKIKNEMNKYNISSNKISANFLLLNFNKCKFAANYIRKRLEKKRILLREMRTYGINNCLRLTVGDSKENKLFIQSMRSIFKNV
jgi:histidinol-phosphate aminotransferase